MGRRRTAAPHAAHRAGRSLRPGGRRRRPVAKGSIDTVSYTHLARSKDYSNITDTFRPGHADYAYWRKFGLRDPRGGGRSSARLTAPTVAAGAVAKKWLAEQYGVKVRGYMSQLGPIPIPFVSWDEVPNNPFYAPNADIVAELEAYMDQLRRDGDSVGARIEVVAENLPAGWGEPIYDRLDADIAHVMMGLNAVKGVSIGAGFDCIAQRGSEHGDEITPDGFVTNHAGGVLGGISTGQPVTVSLAIKPTSSIRVERRSVNRANEPVMVQTLGRHDPCVGIRATPIAEAMLAPVSYTPLDVYKRQRRAGPGSAIVPSAPSCGSPTGGSAPAGCRRPRRCRTGSCPVIAPRR